MLFPLQIEFVQSPARISDSLSSQGVGRIKWEIIHCWIPSRAEVGLPRLHTHMHLCACFPLGMTSVVSTQDGSPGTLLAHCLDEIIWLAHQNIPVSLLPVPTKPKLICLAGLRVQRRANLCNPWTSAKICYIEYTSLRSPERLHLLCQKMGEFQRADSSAIFLYQ